MARYYVTYDLEFNEGPGYNLSQRDYFCRTLSNQAVLLCRYLYDENANEGNSGSGPGSCTVDVHFTTTQKPNKKDLTLTIKDAEISMALFREEFSDY